MERRDVQTLMVGVMLGCLGVLLYVNSPLFATPSPPPRESTVDETVGRYQIVINSNVRADTFLLDTATGRVWVPTRYTNLKGEPTVWEMQDRADSDEEIRDWAQQFELKTPKPRN